MATAVVAHGAADTLRHRAEIRQQTFDRLVGKSSLAVQRLVEIGHVGGVVLAVVDFHGTGVHMGLQRIMGVGQFGQLVCHVRVSSGMIGWVLKNNHSNEFEARQQGRESAPAEPFGDAFGPSFRPR